MEIKKWNRIAAGMFDRWLNSPLYNVTDCYLNCSGAKRNAELWCKIAAEKDDAVRYRIISYNTMSFSCGWVYEDPCGIYVFRVETFRNTYRWRIPDEIVRYLEEINLL